MIIGITGTIGAGKGTIVEYLKKKGFKHYSSREFITQEIIKRGLPVNRDTMVEVGNDLRSKNSPSYIIEELYKEAQAAGGDSIIESLRTMGEVNALREKDDFYLLAVDADQKIRYERIVKRKTETDHISFEEFKAQEAREIKSDDPTKSNLSKCIEVADYKLDNSGDFEEFYQQIEKVINEINNK